MNINYKFRLLDFENYEIDFISNVNNRVLKHIFSKTIRKLKNKEDIQIDADLTKIKEFEVFDRFYPMLKMYISKPFNQVKDSCTEIEKIRLLDKEIKVCKFRKSEDEKSWDLLLTVKGEYVKI